MMVTRQLASLAWRESRSARRRQLLSMSSIVLGVAALVAIDFLAENRQGRGQQPSLPDRLRFRAGRVSMVDRFREAGSTIAGINLSTRA